MYRPILWLFGFIESLDRLRRWNALAFSLVLALPFSLVPIYLPEIAQFLSGAHVPGIEELHRYKGEHRVYWVVFAGAFTFGLEFVFGHLIFPALTYLPWAVATRALGFEAVTRNPDVALRWTDKIVRRACEAKKAVRVICLTGKHLWLVKPADAKSIEDAPLAQAKLLGLVEAVMPASAAHNQTVAFRYATYDKDFKFNSNYGNCEDLVKEMNSGKDDLMSHRGNVIHEHNILCMWRVVLTDEHCITQNYFPNAEGGPSYKAPAFLFRNLKSHRGPDTYYAVFNQMFDLIKKSANQRSSLPPAPGPSSLAPPSGSQPSPADGARVS